MFDKELGASQAYYEFLRNRKQECGNHLKFHVKKKLNSRNKRRFLYVLYSKYFNEKFGERNGISVFEKLDENIKLL